ncbi:hypothetical protein [Fretibacter rubidus]|uniref:hypothetical protein n=1 Tax=Fretibacter rubidus TaxID=570162 RepID=UPI00352B1175
MMMKKTLIVSIMTLPLASCGWWDGAFAPYYAFPAQTASYGTYAYAPTPQTAPGQIDRRRAKGVVSLEGGIGADFIAGGQLIDAGNARIATGAVPQNLAMSDAFGTGTRFDATATYPVSENRYFTGTAYRTTHDGKAVNLRTQTGTPLVGQLSDYRAHGVEFGLRQYAPNPRYVVHPFIEGRVGGAYVDGVSLDQGVSRTALFNSGWVPTGAVVVGFEAPTSNRFTVGMETGIRYQGRLGATPQPLSRDVTGAARASGSLISVPVVLRGRYRF